MATPPDARAPSDPWRDEVDGGLVVRSLSVSTMDNDVYVVACARTGRAVLVDPADDAPLLRRAIAGFDVLAAVVTHGHADHTRAWTALADDPGLAVWAHRGDAERLPAEADRWLEHGERIAVGDLSLEVLHVPGHTPGSIVLAVAGADRTHLFTGDTLFPGGPGSTQGDAARHTLVMDGIERELFGRFDDRTVVHPGHGRPTTLGAERPSLAEWRARGW